MDRADLVRLRRARDRMDRDYAEPLDVPVLAAGALMSVGHFSRMFREAYGESPYGYLMTRRIERAKDLLRHTDLSVTDVCLAVGCSSLGSFSSNFRRLVGVAPSEYRATAAGTFGGVPSYFVAQSTRPAPPAKQPVTIREADDPARA